MIAIFYLHKNLAVKISIRSKNSWLGARQSQTHTNPCLPLTTGIIQPSSHTPVNLSKLLDWANRIFTQGSYAKAYPAMSPPWLQCIHIQYRYIANYEDKQTALGHTVSYMPILICKNRHKDLVQTAICAATVCKDSRKQECQEQVLTFQNRFGQPTVWYCLLADFN